MSMQSHYEINVSRYGKHFFATHPRSLTDENTARKVLQVMRELFIKSDGYEVTISYWDCRGQTPEWDK